MFYCTIHNWRSDSQPCPACVTFSTASSAGVKKESTTIPSVQVSEEAIEAIKFADFINNGNWLPVGKNVWYRNFGSPNYESKTTKELFSIYQHNKTK